MLSPLDWKPKSNVDQIDANVLKDDFLNKSQTIIAFIQNDLSVEQFTTEDTNRLQTLAHVMSDQTIDPVFNNN